MGIFLNRGNEEFTGAVNSEIYVDKTDMIAFFNKVIHTEQRCVSVSRPRRFGKTMAANMIAAYFEKGCDSRVLFENRKLGQMQEWDENLNKYDVIRIDLAGIRAVRASGDEALDYIDRVLTDELIEAYPNVKLGGLDQAISDILARINDQAEARFIIIIDEWDCLFREDKNDTRVQERYINLLRGLFKDNRSRTFLALGYITGILPIKKYNSESALNNFDEFSMISPGPLAKYIGFSTEEVKSLCERFNMDYEEALHWYDGYSFRGTENICGPNSVVKAMLMGQYDNYWSKTVAFTSLLTYITMDFDGLKEAVKIMLGGQRVKVRVLGYQNDMVSFQNKDDVLTVLIHLGYLAYDEGSGEVYIPNREVRQIFEGNIERAGWTLN